MSEPTVDELLVKVRDLIETTDPEEDAREILNDLHILWDKLEGHILAGNFPSKWRQCDPSPLPPIRDLWKMAYNGGVAHRALEDISADGWMGGGDIQLPFGSIPLVEKLLSKWLYESASDRNLVVALHSLLLGLRLGGELQEYDIALIERDGTVAPLFRSRKP